MNRKNILVLGGGFAGLEAAIALAKERFFNVTLISNREYFYVYPISIWIPTRGNAFADVTVPLEKLAERRNFNLIIDEVVEIIKTNAYTGNFGDGKIFIQPIEEVYTIRTGVKEL